MTPPAETMLTGRLKWAYKRLPDSGLVVDIGSSASYLSRLLALGKRHAVCVDLDFAALTLLTTSAPATSAVLASADALPLADAVADVVLLLDVLEHVTLGTEGSVIREAKRVLRSGALLILSVPAQGMFAFLDPQNLRAKLDGRHSLQTEHRHYSSAQVLTLLGDGFKVEEMHHGGLFLSPVMFGLDNFLRKHFRVDWSRTLRRIADLDFSMNWGSASYNLILLARKLS